jgi:hypothetical protein
MVWIEQVEESVRSEHNKREREDRQPQDKWPDRGIAL